jgi:hypothetical protein
MTERVEIPSLKHLFNRFIAEPAQENGVRWLSTHQDEIKANLLEEFRREIFGQVVFKLGPEAATLSKDELANLDGVHSILEQSFRRWRRLCIMCGEAGLHFISLEDLANALTETEEEKHEENSESSAPGEEV